MDPNTGEAFRLRHELVDEMREIVGDRIDMDALRARVALLEDPTDDEVEAAKREQLVAISEDVAHKLQLGARELERRKRRRQAEKRARKRNR